MPALSPSHTFGGWAVITRVKVRLNRPSAPLHTTRSGTPVTQPNAASPPVRIVRRMTPRAWEKSSGYSDQSSVISPNQHASPILCAAIDDLGTTRSKDQPTGRPSPASPPASPSAAIRADAGPFPNATGGQWIRYGVDGVTWA